jgi:hypothetical protein
MVGIKKLSIDISKRESLCERERKGEEGSEKVKEYGREGKLGGREGNGVSGEKEGKGER